MKYREKFAEWVCANPLRKYLTDEKSDGKGFDGLSGVVRQCAADVGVSRQTITSWMYGKFVPRMKHFDKLGELYGISAASWFDWWKARPTQRSPKKQKGSV